MTTTIDENADFLRENLKDLPYFRALLRAVESRFYQKHELNEPILDLGCGDGHFAASTFRYTLNAGVDPWRKELQEAQTLHAHELLLCAKGSEMPFPDEYFGSAISNSVLEHIPQVDDVLVEVARVMKSGGTFIITVPNNRFTENLWIARLLNKAKLTVFANWYKRFFNRISRHEHTDIPLWWQKRLDRAGFSVIEQFDYFSPAALKELELGHYFGLPSWINKKITGAWEPYQSERRLNSLHERLKPFYEEEVPQTFGAYSFFVARKD